MQQKEKAAYRLDGSEASHASSRAVHIAFRAGQSGEVRLRIDEPGEYELLCDVTGHRRGMVDRSPSAEPHFSSMNGYR